MEMYPSLYKQASRDFAKGAIAFWEQSGALVKTDLDGKLQNELADMIKSTLLAATGKKMRADAARPHKIRYKDNIEFHHLLEQMTAEAFDKFAQRHKLPGSDDTHMGDMLDDLVMQVKHIKAVMDEKEVVEAAASITRQLEHTFSNHPELQPPSEEHYTECYGVLLFKFYEHLQILRRHEGDYDDALVQAHLLDMVQDAAFDVLSDSNPAMFTSHSRTVDFIDDERVLQERNITEALDRYGAWLMTQKTSPQEAYCVDHFQRPFKNAFTDMVAVYMAEALHDCLRSDDEQDIDTTLRATSLSRQLLAELPIYMTGEDGTLSPIQKQSIASALAAFFNDNQDATHTVTRHAALGHIKSELMTAIMQAYADWNQSFALSIERSRHAPDNERGL